MLNRICDARVVFMGGENFGENRRPALCEEGLPIGGVFEKVVQARQVVFAELGEGTYTM